ncbi:zinc-finger of the FCS-type, C2-C2, variant 2 [Ancistrocladus abbreviatus]
MLRKRSRPVAGKQTTTPDRSKFSFHFLEKIQRPTTFFFSCTKTLKGLLTNCSSETQPMMSSSSISISILESQSFSALLNPVSPDRKIPNTNPQIFSGNKRHFWDQTGTKGIGLALIDSFEDDENADSNSTTSKQKRKLVVFGSQLKVQVHPPPPLPNSSLFPSNSPDSPPEFGIKTPKSNLWSSGKLNCEIQLEGSSGLIGQSLSMEEMELSEDYTCVISHGPNPKTTRIFGNCVLEGCSDVMALSTAKKNGKFLQSENLSSSPDNFLQFCHHSRIELGQAKDINIYRGEKGFCSQECSKEEMLFHGVGN